MSSAAVSNPHHTPTVNLTKFGMITFLASEVMLFAGLLTAYAISWISKGSAYEPEWLRAEHFSWPLLMTSINTVFLLSSSATLYMAEQAVLKSKSITGWLTLTTVLGAIFVLVQKHEWTELYNDHIWFNTAGTYGSSFFAVTGFHGLHVTIGVIFLAITTMMAGAGSFTPHRHDFLTCVSLYWHFVDVVWIGVFFVFYILPHFFP